MSYFVFFNSKTSGLHLFFDFLLNIYVRSFNISLNWMNNIEHDMAVINQFISISWQTGNLNFYEKQLIVILAAKF